MEGFGCQTADTKLKRLTGSEQPFENGILRAKSG